MAATSTPCELIAHPDLVEVTLHPGVTEASWSDIEAFGANVRQELESRIKPACLIDLSPLNYMGSAMVALIVRIWKVTQSRQGQMVVVAENSFVLDVIRLAGLDKVWTIVSDRAEAAKKLGVRAQRVVPPPAKPEHAGSAPPAKSSAFLYFILGIATVLLALFAAMAIVMNR